MMTSAVYESLIYVIISFHAMFCHWCVNMTSLIKEYFTQKFKFDKSNADGLGISRYQKCSSQYQYQLNSTILDTISIPW